MVTKYITPVLCTYKFVSMIAQVKHGKPDQSDMYLPPDTSVYQPGSRNTLPCAAIDDVSARSESKHGAASSGKFHSY